MIGLFFPCWHRLRSCSQKGIVAFMIMLFPVFGASASGILFLEPGKTLELSARPQIFAFETIWQVFQEGEKIQESKGEDFSETFVKSGKYRIEVIVSNRFGESEKTHIDVVVGDAPPEGTTPFFAKLVSLPASKENGVISVFADTPSLLLFAGASGGAQEYHFDTDLSVDSDGDGDPQNDIDNSTHPSFLTGEMWGVSYASVDRPIFGRLTIVSSSGERKSADFQVQFLSREASDLPLMARIEALPAPNASGVISPHPESEQLVVFSAASEGDIAQYRIDSNLFQDSDGDGDPTNDIDNKDHPSFETGEPFVIPLGDSQAEQIVRLTVVSPEGRGSRVDRRIVVSGQEEALSFEPYLFPEQREIFVGGVLEFHLVGVPGDSQISWDVGGDGVPEQRGRETDFSFSFPKEGSIPLDIHIEGAFFQKTLQETIVVRSASATESLANPPVADFSFTASENLLSFSSLSRVDARLASDQLLFDWDFGDGQFSTEENPQHAFSEKGQYEISLKVTDAVGSSAKKTIVIDIAEGSSSPPPPDQENSDLPENTTQPLDRQSISIPWGGILIALLLLLIFGGVAFLIVKKIQMPDLSFREILEEEWARLLGPSSFPNSPLVFPESVPEKKTIPPDPLSEEEEAIVLSDAEHHDPELTPSVSPEERAPTPPWLSLEEEKTDSSSAAPATPLASQETTPSAEGNAALPNWLKNEDEPMASSGSSSEEGGPDPSWLHESDTAEPLPKISPSKETFFHDDEESVDDPDDTEHEEGEDDEERDALEDDDEESVDDPDDTEHEEGEDDEERDALEDDDEEVVDEETSLLDHEDDSSSHGNILKNESSAGDQEKKASLLLHLQEEFQLKFQEFLSHLPEEEKPEINALLSDADVFTSISPNSLSNAKDEEEPSSPEESSSQPIAFSPPPATEGEALLENDGSHLQNATPASFPLEEEHSASVVSPDTPSPSLSSGEGEGDVSLSGEGEVQFDDQKNP